jgi:hypothetical protein
MIFDIAATFASGSVRDVGVEESTKWGRPSTPPRQIKTGPGSCSGGTILPSSPIANQPSCAIFATSPRQIWKFDGNRAIFLPIDPTKLDEFAPLIRGFGYRL